MKSRISLILISMFFLVPQYLKAFEFSFSNFYVSSNVSCNFAVRQQRHHAKFTFDPGVLATAAVGYRFCNGLRAEGEFGYRYNHLKRLEFYGERFRISGNLETWTGMANLYYDFPLNLCVKPYVGAGIGYGYSRSKLRVGSLSCGRSHRSGFAWQVIAGVAYPIYDHIDLSVEYRFFRNECAKKIQNHSVGGSLRYYF